MNQFREFNHNVKVALLYAGFSSFSTGIWGYTVLSGYLKVVTGSNTKVGIAEGIQGASQVLLAFPAGLLADKFRRDRVMKVSSMLGCIAVLAILVALYSSEIFGTDDYTFTFMCIGLSLWGSYVGLTNPPLEALYADSTTDENRTKMNQFKFSLTLASASSGPLTSLVLFAIVGDYWTPMELRTVFTIGVIVLIPSFIVINFFNDNKAINKNIKQEEEEEEELIKNNLIKPLLQDSEEEDSEEEIENIKKIKKSEDALYWVPRIVVCTDLVAGFASGMTIKFFPLFFKEEALMSPGEVSLLLFLVYTGISIFSFLVRKLTEKVGVINAILTFQVPGSLLLMAIYLMSVGHDVTVPGQVPLWRNKILMGSVYIVRSGLMNSTRPLKRSILMEHVPSESRGTWSAFESLTKFGWSGSAVFGGYLMDHYGYGITFFATSVIQLSYSLSNLLLKFYIKE